MESRKKTVMQDYLAGDLSQAEYENLRRCCTDEAEVLKARIIALRAEQRRQTETLTEANPWLQAFGGLRLPERLDSELAHALIERVTIYESNRITRSTATSSLRKISGHGFLIRQRLRWCGAFLNSIWRAKVPQESPGF